jgi:F-type H+-transporting ATPase subunit delta
VKRKGEAALAAQNSVLIHIARPYAAAMFDLAQSEGALAEVEAGLESIASLAAENPDFSRFLRSPVISADEKAAAIGAILDKSGGVHPLVAKVVRLVARNGRLFALTSIISVFRELAAKARGEVTADVTSAAPLGSDQRKKLADTLKAKIGKTVTLNEHVDPALIGGLVVKVGSQMIDSSLRTKLNAMKIAMKEVR